jgi:hypothetical protein
VRKRTGYLSWLRRREDVPFRDDRLRGGRIGMAVIFRLLDAMRTSSTGSLNQLQQLLSLAMAEPTLSALPGPNKAAGMEAPGGRFPVHCLGCHPTLIKRFLLPNYLLLSNLASSLPLRHFFI